MVRKDYEKLFTFLESPKPPAGLFERIILTIKREQELRQTKKLFFSFLFLLIISLLTTPFSWTLLINQIKNSGILYFVSIAVSDFRIFLNLWQDFCLAILESLPIMAIALFTVNMAIVLFTIRLFLYRKRLLLSYLLHNFT